VVAFLLFYCVAETNHPQLIMPDDSAKPFRRVLEPVERLSEVLFGLIMVLTFTGSLSLAATGHAAVRTMLIGALGCDLAWGIIDAIMYLMASLSERGHNIVALRAVREATEPPKAHRIIADALPPVLASVLLPAELEVMRQKLNQLPEPPARPRLSKNDWRGAFGVFLLVFLSTLPVVIPFVFLREARLALRVSNGIAVVMLFLTGYGYGRYSGGRPWRTGLAMVAVGAACVGLTIALGG
jgi:VIT family